MTRIYLIRHAEAEGNIRRIFQGHYDGDISENGERQLLQLRERCRDFPFDAVYASPLRRTFKTAESANYYHKLPIITDDGLIEINGGCWEGRPWEELPGLYPEENNRWVNEPWEFNPKGGEAMCAVYDRIWNTVIRIVRENRGKNICIVSHGCAIRNFLCRAQGRPIGELNNVAWCDNTAVSIIDFDDDLNPHIVLINDATHLDEQTTTLGKQTWWKDFEPGTEEKSECE